MPTPTGDAGPDAAWSAETRRDDGALAAVAGEWDDLYRRCRAATPFQSGAWLRSWWAVYGDRGRLRLILVRRGGLLMAAAALSAQGRRGTVLSPLGAGLSDFSDVLIADEVTAEATARLVAALRDEAGWDVIRAPEVRPGAALRRLAGVWPAATWHGPASTCLQIPVAPVPEVLAAVPGSTAKTLRKKLRKIEAEGFQVGRVPAGQAADGIRALLQLHRRQWQGRPVNTEHLTERFERHLTTATAELARHDGAVVLHYRLADRLVAGEVLLVGHDFAGAYLFGFDPELRERIDVAAMLISQDITLAGELGKPLLSLLRGDEPYKMRWRPEPVRNAELLLARPGSAAGAAYVRYRTARAAAVAVARRRLPWLLPALDRARRTVAGLRPGRG